MSIDSTTEELIIIMTLGNSFVGKTSFIQRFTENEFQDNYLATVGIDSKTKIIKIKDVLYKIIFYDTAGEERYKSISPNIIKKAQGIIIMYDITNKLSFDSIPEIMKNILDNKEENFPMILTGNKIDLEQQREIAKEEGEKMAEKYGLEFFEISNKQGINIEKVGMTIINKILEKRKDDSAADTNDCTRESDVSYHSKYSNLDGDQSTRRKCC